MIQSGVYNDKLELIEVISNIWGAYNPSTMQFNREELSGILKQVEALSNSTFVKRIIIKDETGINRVIIGNLDV